MEWQQYKFRSSGWDRILYVEDETTERLGTFKVRKYTFERMEGKKAFAEGHTRLADDWAMIYLSTLSGCPVGCKMCGTVGKMVAPLSAQQMIDQIQCMMDGLNLPSEEAFKSLQIKWMYMGEPMLYPKEFVTALRYILELYPNWTHVVSTTGPRANYNDLIDIAREYGDRIEFTLSVHGLTEETRNAVIPFKRKLTLKELIEFGEIWYGVSGRKVSFSYNLINSLDMKHEARIMRQLFHPDKWIPCVQFTHTIDEKRVNAENRSREDLCDEADATVDAFRAVLETYGYKQTQGYYTNRDKLARGCGSLVEYQKYLVRNRETRVTIFDEAK